jgi:hypothetical protein
VGIKDGVEPLVAAVADAARAGDAHGR